MGINLNINANNETEFNQQLQMYLAQGYSMQSNFNGTAILKKKSFSMGVLIVLIIFFFPAAIIYYLVASEDIVTIRNLNEQSSSPNTGTANESFDSYCENCGHGLFKDSKFCPGCGTEVAKTENVSAPKVSENVTEEAESGIIKCENCGTELTKDNKFCSNCGELINHE